MSTVELWSPVNRWAGFYEQSTYGRVRSVARIGCDVAGRRYRVSGRVLQLTDGHCCLSRPGERVTYYPRAKARAQRG